MSSPISPDTSDRIVDAVSTALRRELESVELPDPVELERAPRSLVDAIRAIRRAGGQATTLRTLLDGIEKIGCRGAIFVLRGDYVEAWEGRGFADGALDEASIPAGNDAVACALNGQSAGFGEGGEFAAPEFGQGSVLRGTIEPIQVQEKVVGLLYADQDSPGASWDPVSVATLAELTGLAVERIAIERAFARDAAARSEQTGPVTTPPSSPSLSGSAQTPAAAAEEPFAGHEAAASASAASQAPSPPATSADSGPLPAAAAASDSPEVEDARRFARLLMEEICLYNGDKVEAGRAEGDLLDRLGDEIDQARAMYVQRVPAEVANKGDFFQEALVRVLAAGDESVLGRVG